MVARTESVPAETDRSDYYISMDQKAKGIKREKEETPREVENREGNVSHVTRRVKVGQAREKKGKESSEAEPRYTGEGSRGGK